MAGQQNVHKTPDGRIVYRGRPWSVLTTEARTERIKECYALGLYRNREIAEMLKAMALNGKGYSPSAIHSHVRNHRIVRPKISTKPPPPTMLRRVGTRFVGSKLGGSPQEKFARERTSPGKAIVTALETMPLNESFLEQLKKQKGFCIAIQSNSDYCGKDTGNPDRPYCKGHRMNVHGRYMPDFRKNFGKEDKKT